MLCILGGAIAVAAAWITRGKQRRRDQVWIALSGALSVIILLLLFFAPGVLNIRWAIDKAVPKPDPNHLTVVPIDKRMQKGRPLLPNETVDAATEALRQDDVVISVESAKIGKLTGEGSPHLLVQCRIVNLGQSEVISLEGFSRLSPVLTIGSDRPVPFLEQRLKEIRNRSVLYVEWDPRQAVEIAPRGANINNSQDFMLIFDSPPEGETLQLKLNSAAWGRQGICRFRIAAIDPSKS